jgi:hypothetical protein
LHNGRLIGGGNADGSQINVLCSLLGDPMTSVRAALMADGDDSFVHGWEPPKKAAMHSFEFDWSGKKDEDTLIERGGTGGLNTEQQDATVVMATTTAAARAVPATVDGVQRTLRIPAGVQPRTAVNLFCDKLGIDRTEQVLLLEAAVARALA